jgi:hypothetical protein
MTEAKYLRCSLQTLSDQLAARGPEACPTTVGKLLREMEYDLYVNVKRFTGPAHPARDSQFQYLAALAAAFRDAGLPILSVDTKKKELIGNFAHAGATWRQEADAVNAHDFLTDAQYRGVPYGLYDVLADQGHVVVGTSAGYPAVRCRGGRALVGPDRVPSLPRGGGTAGAGRQRGQQRLSTPSVEVGLAGVGRGSVRLGGDRRSLSDGGVEVESRGAPPVRPY